MMKSNIKILQLGKFFPIMGGVEKVMFTLTDGLYKRGIHCDMMCASQLQEKNIDLHPRLILCSAWLKVAATMISPSMITRLRSSCKKYDIIHIHHPDPMACLALKLSGYRGKVVLHWHSDIIRQKRFLEYYLPLQQWLIDRADLIIGTTPWYITGSPYLKSVQYKTGYLPIGVDPMCPNPKIMESITSRYQGKKIIFSLGRLVPYKGFSYLVDAAHYLPNDYVIVIGGCGPLRGELQGQINRNNLSRKVKLIDRISDEELASYYGSCRLFCLSSVQKTEAFGIVQIEAMSCGKPVVATSIPNSGVAWVNTDGFSGRIVKPGDAKALADAFIEISEDDETYHRYCSNAYIKYASHFTKKQMIDNCLYLYSNL